MGRLLLLLLLTTLSLTAAAEIYRWVDENGVTVFSEHPPPGGAAEMSGETPPDAKSGSVRRSPNSAGWRETPIPGGESMLDGPIAVSGTVVDGNGSPLKEAKVSITGYDLSSSPYEPRRRDSKPRVLPDGTFMLRCDQCNVLVLKFSKDGYYPAEVEVSYLQESGDGIPRLRKAMPDGSAPLVEKRGVVVTLEEIAHPVRLREYHGTLSSGPDWTDHVLVIDADKGRVWSLPHLQSSAGTTGEMPTYLKLDPGLNSSTLKLGINYRKAGRPRPPPVTQAYLEIANGEGGFVSYRPSTPVVKEAYRAMKAAPEQGYKRRFAVERLSQGNQFFYCRINGKYGKGRVTALRYESRKGVPQAVAAAVEIYLNEDGGRHLESLRVAAPRRYR